MTIRIGYLGEQNANNVRIDIKGLLEKWPGSYVTLFVTRPEEDDETPYIADTSVEENTLIWHVNAYDTEIKGHGKAQIVFTDTQDSPTVIGKSEVMDVLVQESLEGTEEAEIPDPYDTWVATISGYASNAHNSELNSEAWAKGTRNGTPVSSGDEAYQANAKYYATQAGGSAAAAADYETGAAGQALVSEGYAVGKQNGTDVTSGSPYYHNNAKYFRDMASSSASSASSAASSATSSKNQASASAATATQKATAAANSASEAFSSAQTATQKATAAGNSATAAESSAAEAESNALASEGYAVGKQSGADVTSGSPYYHNNAKYFRDMASSSASSASSAASSATSSKNQASASATTASQKATAASNSANDAASSAQTASQKATAAENSATAAAGSADEATTYAGLANGYRKDAEAWAKGTRGGEPVESGDEAYEANAKYYADEAKSYADTITPATVAEVETYLGL